MTKDTTSSQAPTEAGDDTASSAALLERMLRAKYEPIAIVGMGLRFPGGNETRQGFAEFLRAGGCGTGPIPDSRWDVEAFSSHGRTEPGRVRTVGGGFLGDLTRFDARFFNISPKEARYLDPQQRLALETAWEALEDAGVDPSREEFRDGGVYVGVSCVDYTIEVDDLAPEELDPHVGTGTAHSAVPGRISYFLGWRGPSMAVDTACSSSLTALHLAVSALRGGECSIALCGGVNAIHHPRNHIVFSQANMLAPDGRCKTFDEAADGYARSEGAGMVVLKRYSDARREGDRILGIVRGTAVRQDGESGGLTVPNGAAQQAVMRAAITAGSLEPRDIGAVEAHGTGTSLGDPIEMAAIAGVFAESHTKDSPVLVSSLKTNIGHMEAAAGIGGVVKAVLQLQALEAAPHLHLENPTSHIDWDTIPVEVPVVPTPWGSRAPRVLVNSFGFAGSIASAVLERPPAPSPTAGVEAADEGAVDGPAPVLTLSARTPEALRALAARHADHPVTDIRAHAGSSNTCRAHFPHRRAGVVRDRSDLERFLADVERSAESSDLPDRRRLAMLFTGQGSQYVGMGRDLYARHEVFRSTVDACGELFSPGVGDDVRAVITGELTEPERLQQTVLTQPALFTVELALFRLWESLGLRADVLLGHSVGELVALTCADVLDLEVAAHVTAERARLMQSVVAPGGMAAVLAAPAEVEPFLTDRARLSFAAFNSPSQCVVSGALDALEDVTAALESAGHRVSRLRVSHAFHSPLMDEVREQFREVVGALAPRRPRVPVVSNVTGEALTVEDVMDPDYWLAHLSAPVRFVDGVRAVDARGAHAFLEVGPSDALGSLGRRTLPGSRHSWISSMAPGDPDRFYAAAAALYEQRLDIDWASLHGSASAGRADLPLYPFDRSRRHWLTPQERRHGGISRAVAGSRSDTGPGDPAAALLGREDGPEGEVRTFRAELALADVPWLADHVVMGQVVFPATGYVELVLQLTEEVLGTAERVVNDLVIHEPLLVDDERVVELVTRCAGSDETGFTVTVHSRPTEGGTQPIHHLSATLASAKEHADWQDRLGTLVADLGDLARQHADRPGEADVADTYAAFDELGLSYGPEFRRLTALRRADETTVVANLRGRRCAAGEFSSPQVLDNVIQSLGLVVPGESTYLPVGAQAVHLLSRAKHDALVSVARLRGTEGDELAADLLLLDGTRPVLVVHGLRLHKAARGATRSPLEHELHWVRRSLVQRVGAARSDVTLLGAGSHRDRIGAALRARGHSVQEGLPTSGAEVGQHVVFVWSPGSGPVDAARAESECASNLSALVECLRRLEDDVVTPPRLWLVTEQAQVLPGDGAGDGDEPPASLLAATLWGFGLSTWTEHAELGVTLLDSDGDASPMVDEIEHGARDEQAVAFRGRHRFVRRLRPAAPLRPDDAPNTELATSPNGVVDELVVRECEDPDPTGTEVRIEVDAVGLNFKDVLNNLGMLEAHAREQGLEHVPLPLGFEGAGRVVSAGQQAVHRVGERVFFSHLGSLRRRVTIPSARAVLVPDTLSTYEAAGLATAYITAHHALVSLARLRPEDTVLVHAAAGGVGQAAVQLARAVGARVIATASESKRDHLRAQGIADVFDSRTTSFEADVLTATGGRGVDVVLNSLNGEFVDASMRCLATGGRFVELGKLGVWSRERAAAERPDCDYHVFDLSELPESELHEVNARGLHEVARMLASGVIGPLPTTVHELDEAGEAFAVLSRGANLGKLVIRMQDRDPRPAGAEVEPGRLHVLTGGSGALAGVAAAKLAALGATHLLLVSRKGLTPEQRSQLVASVGPDVVVESLAADVTAPDVVELVHGRARTLGVPIGSVVHCAGVLADRPAKDLSPSGIWTVLAPKVVGALAMHRLTASEGDRPATPLVLFSSVASVVGSAGQANYAAANAYLDALAEWRHRAAMPATSLNWGPWAELGMAASLDERHIRSIEAQGMRLLAPGTALRGFAKAFSDQPPHRVLCRFDWPAFLATRPAVTARYDVVVEGEASPAAVEVDTAALAAASPVERAELLVEVVRSSVARLLQFGSAQEVPAEESFHALGLDSLAAVELKNTLMRAFGVALPSSVALDFPTARSLAARLDELLHEATEPAGQRPDQPVDQLSDDEARDELARLQGRA